MKVNLKKPFRDIKGNPVKLNGSDHLISDAVSFALFNLAQIGGQPASAEQKYQAYSLFKKVQANPSEVELSTEEGTFVKQICVEVLSAGAYGQLVDTIEGK